METTNFVKSELVDNFYRRLIDTYGYAPGQIERDYPLGEHMVDIVIWPNEERRYQNDHPELYVVVVCRVEHLRIEANKYFENCHSELLNSRHFFVANNLKETRVFYNDNSRPDGLVLIADFPYAADLITEDALDKFISKMNNNSKEALLAAFSRCHNIIRNNDKLSPEAAFDEISKVIFIKMKYERSNPQEELIYSEKKFLTDEMAFGGDGYMDTLLKDVISEYVVDSLFDYQDRIRIKRQSFLQILKELEIVDFYYTQEDVKGLAFEAFLGKTFRGELGQFFTPRTVVNFMVDVLDIKEGEMVCDPCCGSGGFLIRAFEHIQEQIEKSIDAKIKEILFDDSLTESDRSQRISNLRAELDKDVVGSRMWKLCNSYLYGVDANPRMARTSKMNMIMHGDGHVGVYQHDGLTNVGKIKEEMFDVVLINPPYGVHIDRKQVDDNTGRPLGKQYELKSTAAEALFIERTINLLKPGGRAGLVLPDGVMTNKSNTLREYVERHAKILNITSIPADVFLASGANVKPSLLFIQKLKAGEDAMGEKDRISISMVSNAGINSLGLPSNNSEFQELAPLVSEWIQKKNHFESASFKTILRGEMDRWSISANFQGTQARYNAKYPTCRLSELITNAGNIIYIQPDVTYARITVRLFNKGLCLRDSVKGVNIGTKKQTQVRVGDFVISKIDGKSGAFGYVPKELDGAIVTPDFLVFRVNTDKVLPEYLEFILSSDEILNQYKVNSTGSTGRKRLQTQILLNTIILLPPLAEQHCLIDELIKLKKEEQLIQEKISMQEHVLKMHLFKK